MSYQALIFDCDGTLTNSMPAHYVAWNRVLTRRGIVFEESRFYALAGVPTHKILTMLSQEQGIPINAQEAAREYEVDFLSILHLVTPIEPVVSIVREHFGKLKMAVASGGWTTVVRRQLQQIGYLTHFDALVCAEDTERHKPEPDCFLEAARRLGVAPEHCCVYEDADLGIEAARRAGMACVDVRGWYQPGSIAVDCAG